MANKNQENIKQQLSLMIQNLNNGKLEEVKKIGMALLKEHKNNPAIYNILGIVAYNEKNVEEAIYHFKMALQLNENNFDAYNNLGKIYKEKGSVNESVESYKKAISIKPDFIQGHINLGLVLLERGDLRQGHESIYGVEGVIKFNDKNCKVLNKL